MPQQQARNEDSIAFFSRVQERCSAIASLPTSQHDTEIQKLRAETGLEISTIAPIVESYSFLRVPDFPSLARQFCERIGRDAGRAMLLTGYGQRELTRHVQTALDDERLSITGPRVSLFIDAIKVQFQTTPQPLTIVWGAPSLR